MRYRSLLGILLICIGMAAPSTPQGEILPRHVMVSILVHTELANAWVLSQDQLSPTEADTLLCAHMQRLCDTHQITLSSFQQSYAYYGQHPAWMQELYGWVVVELEKLLAQAD